MSNRKTELPAELLKLICDYFAHEGALEKECKLSKPPEAKKERIATLRSLRLASSQLRAAASSAFFQNVFLNIEAELPILDMLAFHTPFLGALRFLKFNCDPRGPGHCRSACVSVIMAVLRETINVEHLTIVLDCSCQPLLAPLDTWVLSNLRTIIMPWYVEDPKVMLNAAHVLQRAPELKALSLVTYVDADIVLRSPPDLKPIFFASLEHFECYGVVFNNWIDNNVATLIDPVSFRNVRSLKLPRADFLSTSPGVRDKLNHNLERVKFVWTDADNIQGPERKLNSLAGLTTIKEIVGLDDALLVSDLPAIIAHLPSSVVRLRISGSPISADVPMMAAAVRRQLSQTAKTFSLRHIHVIEGPHNAWHDYMCDDLYRITATWHRLVETLEGFGISLETDFDCSSLQSVYDADETGWAGDEQDGILGFAASQPH